jgi:hypothetical protein
VTWPLWLILPLLAEGASSVPCKRVDPYHGAQYMTYERHGSGAARYANESTDRVWFRFHNNTTCPIGILAGSPVAFRKLPDGKVTPYRPYGDTVMMDLEVTDPESHGLRLAYGGDTRNETTMQPEESVLFDVAANHLRAGPIAVRFWYVWDGGTDIVEHRAVFDPSALPADVREWLASTGAK